jgi:hypothetical protein
MAASELPLARAAPRLDDRRAARHPAPLAWAPANRQRLAPTPICQSIDWFRRAPPRAATRAAASAATAAAAPPAVQLSAELRNTTAVVQAEGATVYVLGVSHCSQASCRHIRELIAAVQPETVLLELCKDRTDLLLDPAGYPTLWHPSAVRLVGALPAGGPGEGALLARLQSRRGAAVGAAEIEGDALALLATGLFRSAQPVTRPPAATAAPAFVVGPGGRLRAAAPLGAVEFAVVARSLPAVSSFQAVCGEGLNGDLLTPEAAENAAALATNASGGALSALLQARQALLAALPLDADVALTGVEGGRVVAAARRLAAGERRALTGLEGSAAGGQGWGIDPFKRQARAQQQAAPIAGGLNILMDDQPRENGAATPPPPATAAAAAAAGVALTPWTEAQLRDAAAAADREGAAPQQAGGVEGAFASLLTRTYGRFQADAGRSAGVAPGAAWRAALEAAAAAGSRYVLLGDRPVGVTGFRLARAMWASSAPLLLGALPAAAAAAVLVSQALQEDPAAPAAAPLLAAALPLGAAAAPILAPLLEVWRFSRMGGAEIEETVRLKEPLQRAGGDPAAAPALELWGEDALLKWPGAMAPVIHERDDYMARALAAAVAGRPEGGTPAFVRRAGADGREAFQYAMPQGASSGVCPPGRGDGSYALPAGGGGKTVVAVVGTAHVRGIVKVWQAAARPGGDVALEGFL